MDIKKSAGNFTLKNAGFYPQEEMLETQRKQSKLVIGIPKDNDLVETRVGLTPEAVEILVSQGHEIIIESGAGKAANYSDHDYSENGGFIVKEKGEVLQCDIILKISTLTEEEIDKLKGDQIIFTSLTLPLQKEEYFRKLMKKKVIAVAFELLRDDDNSFPVIKGMSEIAGTTSVLIASEYLSSSQKGKGVLLGGVSGITPAEVLILGAGTAGEYAAKAALGLGASIKVYDYSLIKLRRFQRHLGRRVYTSVFHPRVLDKDIQSADAVIGALYKREDMPPFIISEEHVKKMKDGSVIVDLSIDQGGSVETSKIKTIHDPSFVKHGVTHYCVPNVAAKVGRTASIALSNVFYPLIQIIGEYGGIMNYLRENRGLRSGVYIYNGILTNNQIGHLFNIPSRDIDLLMAAF